MRMVKCEREKEEKLFSWFWTESTEVFIQEAYLVCFCKDAM